MQLDVVQEILSGKSEKQASTQVDKHIQLNYDVGNLLATDNNDLDESLLRRTKDQYLLSLTRDNVQLLVNKIWELPTERVEEALVAKLPPGAQTLPRAKPVPKPRPLTKWEQFAKEKGIDKKKKSKLTWDEELNKWIPRYGYKRTAAEREKDWVIEVPDNADPYEDQFAKKSEVKAEKVAKNELQRLRNIAKAKNVKVPRMGLIPDVSNAKDLSKAVGVAKLSTASVGKFQPSLPKEKETKFGDLIPVNRKRKLEPISGTEEKGKNLELIEGILSKKPKINIEKAVNVHMNHEDVMRQEDKKKYKAEKQEKQQIRRKWCRKKA